MRHGMRELFTIYYRMSMASTASLTVARDSVASHFASAPFGSDLHARESVTWYHPEPRPKLSSVPAMV
jgi:hypothetical protein